MTRDASAIPIQSPLEMSWGLPYRGTVGMACLIVAESAIFTIFVVAYIFYIGKSLTGPTPAQVLELPIFGTICLLSSSVTVHFSVSALRKGNLSRFTIYLAGTVLLGSLFLIMTAREWYHLIHDEGLLIAA
jgi:cytochrome c oxidase subunit 3/cytochrome o ubiquinol oxidase subunit 3